MHPPISCLLLALLLVPCAFAAIGISGTGIEYKFDGSRFSAVMPACAVNSGEEAVPVAVHSGNGCIRAVFAGGANETVLGPGAEECMGLELACTTASPSVDITLVPTGGMVRGGVVRTAKITYLAPAVVPENETSGAGEAPANGTANQPQQGSVSGPKEADNVVNSPLFYGIVIILVIVIASVCAWYLARSHFRH